MLPQIRKILYASDLGRFASLVFRHAVGLAEKHGAELYILHVVEPLSSNARRLVDLFAAQHADAGAEQRHWNEVLASARQSLQRFCAAEADPQSACGLDAAGIQVLQGRPADVILEEAARLGADLIVLGSHNHTAAGEALLGSVAHRVLQKADVPVLLVRVPNAQTEDGL
jgi:nucleotide-binding universal stress UspA family protein